MLNLNRNKIAAGNGQPQRPVLICAVRWNDSFTGASRVYMDSFHLRGYWLEQDMCSGVRGASALLRREPACFPDMPAAQSARDFFPKILSIANRLLASLRLELAHRRFTYNRNPVTIVSFTDALSRAMTRLWNSAALRPDQRVSVPLMAPRRCCSPSACSSTALNSDWSGTSESVECKIHHPGNYVEVGNGLRHPVQFSTRLKFQKAAFETFLQQLVGKELGPPSRLKLRRDALYRRGRYQTTRSLLQSVNWRSLDVASWLTA